MRDTPAAPIARGVLVLWLAASSGCTLLDPTDYLSKDYGQGDAARHSCQGANAASLFCEDFETGTLASSRWGSREPSVYGMREVDAARAHWGSYSLHAELLPGAPTTTVYAVATHSQAFPAHVFTRAFVYADVDRRTSPENVVSVQRAAGTSGVQLGLQQNWSDPRAEAVELNFWGNSGTVSQASNAFALGAWQCVEAEVDEEVGVVRVWLEGGPPLEISGLTLEAFDDIEIGASYSGPVMAADNVWLDDLIVSTSRVGCAE